MNYPGGKNGFGAYQKIICQMPPHDLYLEPFLGSGAVLRAKRPARINIAVEIEPGAVAAFGCLPGVEVLNDCGMSFMENYRWQGNELVYADPPYLLSTRRSRSHLYLREISEDDHRRLLSIIKKIPAMVMISGYWSQMYATELKEWRFISWQSMTRGGKPATEYLWMNYEEPVELHDYQYLGKNKSERQRIKRKIERWERKLERMPMLERQAILAALARRSS